MKSVIIRELKTGQLLIKVKKTKKGFDAECRDDLPQMRIVVIDDDNSRTCVLWGLGKQGFKESVANKGVKL